MRVVAGLLVVLGVLAALGWLHLTREEPAGVAASPDVVIVTLDTTRADHCSFLGYARETTPRLAAVAREGASFLAAYTPTPTTGPAHATLLTGTHPRTHGVLRNGWSLGSEPETLAETLAMHGYVAGAVVSAFPLARRFGFAQGFGHYDDEFLPAEASLDPGEWDGVPLDEAFDRRARATTDRALGWLASVPRDRPMLLWVHYYDPHSPYDPPPRHRELFPPAGPGRLARQVARYDAEIHFADDEIGRLLDGLGRLRSLEHTLLVVATDHGEGLMQHGWMEHGIDLHEELVRVALVLRLPGRIVPARPAEPVSLADVAPTVLGLLALPAGGMRSEGQDLSPLLLRAAPAPAGRTLHFQRRFYTRADEEEWPARGEMVAVRSGQWKYVEAPEQGLRQLFDLAADPGETRDLVGAEPARAAELARLLGTWREAPGGRVTGEQAVSEDDRRRLRALGYLD
jgi:arylsulfatase A-like enzyme